MRYISKLVTDLLSDFLSFGAILLFGIDILRGITDFVPLRFALCFSFVKFVLLMLLEMLIRSETAVVDPSCSYLCFRSVVN